MKQLVQKNRSQHSNVILCEQCDLVVSIRHSDSEDKVRCPRCQHWLIFCKPSANQHALIYGVCALVMFFIACAFYLIDIRIVGRINNITLSTIPRVLFADDYLSLSVLFTLLVIIFPFSCMLSLVTLCSGIAIPNGLKRILLVINVKLESWCMAEIFLAGMLVSFVKLNSYGDIAVGISFLPFCFFILLQIKAVSSFNRPAMWYQLGPSIQTDIPVKPGRMGKQQRVRLCVCCHAILARNQRVCPRCFERGDVRISKSLQWTFALLLTAMMLYVPANLLAVMRTLYMGGSSNSTILNGITYMWNDGDYPIAIIIFFASIIIPVLKIVTLFWLCHFSIYSSCGKDNHCLTMSRLYNSIELIGRWSMIDIFVVAVNATLIRNGELISVYPDTGAIFFAAVVIMTMVASKKYDPRLIWDKVTCNE